MESKRRIRVLGGGSHGIGARQGHGSRASRTGGIGQSVLEALRSQNGVVVVKRLGHAIEVSGSRKDDKDVEDLMRASPDIKHPGSGSLGPASLVRVSQPYTQQDEKTYRIKEGTEDIHSTMQGSPAQTHTVLETLYAVDESALDDGDDTRKTETNEHHSSIGPPSRGAETLNPRYNSTAKSKNTNLVPSATLFHQSRNVHLPKKDMPSSDRDDRRIHSRAQEHNSPRSKPRFPCNPTCSPTLPQSHYDSTRYER